MSTQRPKLPRPKPSRPGAKPLGWRRGVPQEAKTENKPLSATVGIRILTFCAVALLVFVGVFTPLKNWMEQREQAQQLAMKVAAVKVENNRLKQELARWKDPDFIKEQARLRLGYVHPGEITYVVMDAAGKPDNLSIGWKTDPEDQPLPWFMALSQATQAAGTGYVPPRQSPRLIEPVYPKKKGTHGTTH